MPQSSKSPPIATNASASGLEGVKNLKGVKYNDKKLVQ